jgi:PTS system galactitol-specific IIA component
MIDSSDNQLQNLIPPEFVLVDLDASDKTEAISALAAVLRTHLYVKDSYLEAVLTREEEFPTGLRTMDVHVAIPHCDVGHCLKPGIAVGVLSKPVQFLEMATTDQVVDTEIIFLLAITEPDHQVVWLSRLVNLFQTPGFLAKLRDVSSPAIGHKTIIDALEKEVEAEK